MITIGKQDAGIGVIEQLQNRINYTTTIESMNMFYLVREKTKDIS